jgi:hypothetical protein
LTAQTVSESRKKMLKQQLDYRFKGGLYTFENYFYKNAEYPEIARDNCIQGIIIASFDVSCDGKMSDVTIKNPLHYGIDEEVKKFFEVVKDKWNTCKDSKYEHFEIPIQFKLEGTEMNAEDALFVFESKNPGYICHGDEYFLNKAKKYLDKGNGKSAMEYLNILIKRDPYNMEYYEMKKQAIELSGKKKKKNKDKSKKDSK